MSVGLLGAIALNDLRHEAFPGPDRPSPETPMGASGRDVVVAILLSPLILAWFVVTLIGHGLRNRR